MKVFNIRLVPIKPGKFPLVTLNVRAADHTTATNIAIRYAEETYNDKFKPEYSGHK